MNILISADYSTPRSGSFGASLIALGRALRKQSDRAIFVFPKEREWLNWFRGEDFEVIVTGDKGLDAASQYEILHDIIDKYQIQLVHTHFGMFHYALTHHRSAWKEVKVIIQDHMDFSVQPNLAKQYLKTMLRSINYAKNNINLIAVMKRKTNAYFFLKHKWYVPNGLPLERYMTTPSMTREVCRETFEIEENAKICLLLGWDLKRKGLDIALKAIKKCRETDPSICLGIIGAGKGAPSDFAKEFIGNTTDIDPKESWIHYLNDYEDIFAVHRAIDVYLSASRMEAFSFGILESISQDTPVVISDIPGTHWADIYDNSYFYPVEDPDACADAILKALAEGRRKSNSKDVVAKYGIDQWCEKIMEIYRYVS